MQKVRICHEKDATNVSLQHICYCNIMAVNPSYPFAKSLTILDQNGCPIFGLSKVFIVIVHDGVI